jgi:hypothetical protein
LDKSEGSVHEPSMLLVGGPKLPIGKGAFDDDYRM